MGRQSEPLQRWVVGVHGCANLTLSQWINREKVFASVLHLVHVRELNVYGVRAARLLQVP